MCNVTMGGCAIANFDLIHFGWVEASLTHDWLKTFGSAGVDFPVFLILCMKQSLNLKKTDYG